MEEEHYYTDCIYHDDKNSTYIDVGGKTDTRLIVYQPEENGKKYVLRPPSLSDQRRFSIGPNYLEVAKNFQALTSELNEFDIQIPEYMLFVSHFHTKEGSKGSGLCLMSEFIEGRCLPLDYQCCWDYDKENFYIQMDKWLTNITNYSLYKYLSADKSSFYLTDIFRPVQFVYECESNQIFLVDLDPFLDKTINENGKLSKRFLIGLSTINKQRNLYLNKMNKDGIKIEGWGKKSLDMMKELLETTDFIKDAVYNEETDTIMRNLKQGLYYKKFNKV